MSRIASIVFAGTAVVLIVLLGIGIFLGPSDVGPSPVPGQSGGATPTPGATPLPAFVSVGGMIEARGGHTATLLTDGRVLVAGGTARFDGPALASTELYDPRDGSWTATGPMGVARSFHTATLLPDGKVLVVGGFDDFEAISSAELYDPASGSWTATGPMIERHGYHTATLLPDGRVLVAGGRSNNSSTGGPMFAAELYDPIKGSWAATGNMVKRRMFHTATLLPTGKVLVLGTGSEGYNTVPLASAELYDPASESWTETTNMPADRFGHTATLLADGKVLVAGGIDIGGPQINSVNLGIWSDSVPLAAAVLYDPSTVSWLGAGSLDGRVRHTATLLRNGEVLLVGGYDHGGPMASAELYGATSGWIAAASLITARTSHTATLLADGSVLVVGGYARDGDAMTSAELYGPGGGG
jgi:hypothetical protein